MTNPKGYKQWPELTDAEKCEAWWRACEERDRLRVALETAARRFEFIAGGASRDIADPAVGAKEAREALNGAPPSPSEPTARRSGELLPCENCGHGIVAHVQNGGNCPTPPLKSEAERIYGSLTARDPEDVTRALWTRTGYWKEWRNPGPKCPRCHQFEGHSPECNAVRT